MSSDLKNEKTKRLKLALEQYVKDIVADTYLEKDHPVELTQKANSELQAACEAMDKGAFYISFFLEFYKLQDLMVFFVLYPFKKLDWVSDADWLEYVKYDNDTYPYQEEKKDFFKNKSRYLKLWERIKNGEIWDIVMSAKYSEGRLIRWF